MKAKAKGGNARLKLTISVEEAEALQQELHAAWQRAGTWNKLGEHLSELDDLLDDFLSDDEVFPIIRGAE